jgi:threonine/homoserine/homoserine lactone efflux protein
VPASSVIAFWAVALLLIAVPGADWAYAIGAGLAGRSVPLAIGGLVLGYAALTVLVAVGVGALVAGTPALLTAVTVLGGAYLVWQGLMTVARPAVPTVGGAPAGSRWTTLTRGVGVSGLNPKGLLLFLAVLPQFTDPHGSWPVAGQIGALGLLYMASCGTVYLGVGLLARTVLAARPAVARAVSRVSGACMIAIGAALLAERLLA